MNYNRTINGRPLVGLSPMAGYTDSAFRGITRRLGADFVVTELVSADGIIQSWKAGQALSRTFELMYFAEEERPVLVQLFGGDPSKIEEAAKIVVGELAPDGLDINMGCPAHKVVCNGYGSALLKDPKLAARVVKAAKKGSGLNVTVKTRIGWSDDSMLDEFALSIADAGASMLALHGRTYAQGFSGVANWEPIYRVKGQVHIPVFGNGDVRSGTDAVEKIKDLDGILIGRAAVGNPWVFAEVQNALLVCHSNENRQLDARLHLSRYDNLEGDNSSNTVSLVMKMAMLRQHARVKFSQKGERGLVEMRKFLPAYIKGLPGAADLRMLSNQLCSLEDIEVIIAAIEKLTDASSSLKPTRFQRQRRVLTKLQ